MRRAYIGFIGALLLLPLGVMSVLAIQDDATLAVEAYPASGDDFMLLSEEQVPDGLVVIQEGTRTHDDVAAGFDDPTATIEQFQEWGWQGNHVQAFHLPEGAEADPTQIDGIYLSVHEFGSPESAAAALDYSFDVHAAAAELEEVSVADLGDAAHALYGRLSYGSEITLYVQHDMVLIRLSVASPEGDPTHQATELMETLLGFQQVSDEA